METPFIKEMRLAMGRQENVQVGQMANLYLLILLPVYVPRMWLDSVLSLYYEGWDLICSHAINGPDNLNAVSQDAQPKTDGVDLG